MKTILTAVAFAALMGGAAYASGLSDPIVEPEIIVVDTVENSNSLMIFAALAVIAIILGTAN